MSGPWGQTPEDDTERDLQAEADEASEALNVAAKRRDIAVRALYEYRNQNRAGRA